MMTKPVILREQADRDIDDALQHYHEEAGIELALDFIEQLQAALTHIRHYPATGSPRYAFELDLPGLRFWPLKRYPHLVFYIEQDAHIDVWRVLHGRRDLPRYMGAP